MIQFARILRRDDKRKKTYRKKGKRKGQEDSRNVPEELVMDVREKKERKREKKCSRKKK